MSLGRLLMTDTAAVRHCTAAAAVATVVVVAHIDFLVSRVLTAVVPLLTTTMRPFWQLLVRFSG